MKQLTVVIRAEFSIPDDWHLVTHPSGIQALKIGDHFVGFDVMPIETKSKRSNAEWSDATEGLIEGIIDTVIRAEAELVVGTQH